MAVTVQVGSVEILGQRYPFACSDALGVRDLYERWIADLAYRKVWDLRRNIQTEKNPEGFLTEAEWEKERSELHNDLVTFQFCWGTLNWFNVFSTPLGRRKLMECQLVTADPKFDPKVLEELYRPTDEASSQRRVEIAEYMYGYGRDPNSSGAEKKEATDSSAPTK